MKFPILFFHLLGLYFYSCNAQINYLTAAHESAMYVYQAFDESAEYYRDFLSYEAETLANELVRVTGSILERPGLDSTSGERVSQCALDAATKSFNVTTSIMIQMEAFVNECLELHQIVVKELTYVNIMTVNFDEFYLTFSYRLVETNDRIKDILTIGITEATDALIDNYNEISAEMERCYSF